MRATCPAHLIHNIIPHFFNMHLIISCYLRQGLLIDHFSLDFQSKMYAFLISRIPATCLRPGHHPRFTYLNNIW
jgi:hypothetical protein